MEEHPEPKRSWGSHPWEILQRGAESAILGKGTNKAVLEGFSKSSALSKCSVLRGHEPLVGCLVWKYGSRWQCPGG